MFYRIINGIKIRFRRIKYSVLFKKCGKNLRIDDGVIITYPETVSVGNNVTINKRALIQCHPSVSIQIGNNVVMSYDSMILTGVHPLELSPKHHIRKNVVVEDNARILAKVIVTSGVVLGRGCIIGAGSVVRNNIPPYAVVAGNPAKIVGFVASPEEILAFEEKIYQEEERTPLNVLESNYEKYFLSRIHQIKDFNKL